MSLPRFGYDNILHRFRNCVWTPFNDTVFPYRNAFDFRPGTFWKPDEDRNFLLNAKLLTWSGGASAAPDNFTISGAGATVARTTDFAPGNGPYAAVVTRAGADAALIQNITGYTGYLRHKVTYGCWVKATVASRARIAIYDGATFTGSSFHTGGGGWEWLSVTALVGAAASMLRLDMRIDSGNTSGTFSGPALVLGDTISATPHPENANLFVFPANNQLLPAIWMMQDFPNGIAAAPDGFTLVGSGATCYATMDNSPKIAWRAAGVTRVGNDCYLEYTVGSDVLSDVIGTTISFGCWARATVASRGYISIAITASDGSTVYVAGTSSAHTGGSAYEWLYVNGILVPTDVTAVSIRMMVSTGNTSVEFCGPLLVKAATATSLQTPHAQSVNYMAHHSHNMGSAGYSVASVGSDDNFASTTSVLSATPTDDKSSWKDLNGAASISKKAYRLRYTRTGSAAKRLEIGVVHLGTYLEMPWSMDRPFDGLGTEFESEAPETRLAGPLGRSIPATWKSYTVTFPMLTRTFAKTSLLEGLWAHGGGVNGLPFFFQWNDSSYPTETDFVWLAAKDRFSAPQLSGGNVTEVSFDLIGSMA